MPGAGWDPEGPGEIQLRLRLSVAQTITIREGGWVGGRREGGRVGGGRVGGKEEGGGLHYSPSDFSFRKPTKQKIGPAAATVICDLKRNHGSEAAAGPSACLFHNPHAQASASTSLDHKIILVLDAELARVRALLVKGLDHSTLPSTLELVRNVPYLLRAHKQN